MERPNVLVIGAGPAGSCAAAMLAKGGLSVQVVEAQQFPRFVIGESLLPQCMDILAEAGLVERVEQAGYQIKTGGTFRHREKTEIFDFSQTFTDGWDYTYQVMRDRFDQLLVDGAKEMGAQVAFGHRVESVDFGGDAPTVVVASEGGESHTVRPEFVIDASGYGRVLPRLLGLEASAGMAGRTSVFCHIRDDGELALDYRRISILIHPEIHEVWYWHIPLHAGRSSVGVVGPDSYFERFGGDHEAALRTAMSELSDFAQAFPTPEFLFPVQRKTAFAKAVSRMCGPGYAILGNAGEFLDPVFSSGVTVALKSASLASRALLRERAGETVDWEQAYEAELRRGIDVFKTYVNAWYGGTLQRIFFAEQKVESVKRKICSVLAGYAWDRDNEYVASHARVMQALGSLFGGEGASGRLDQ